MTNALVSSRRSPDPRAAGQTLTFGYEPIGGRLTSLTAPTGTATYGYESGTSRLASVTAPGASLAYGCDGSLLRSETWSGTVAGAVAWTYDPDFRMTGETVRNGSGVTFGYDNDGLLMSAGATTVTRATATGLLTSSAVGAVATGFSYNGFGELTSHATTIGGTPVYSAGLARDAGGRISQQSETLAGVPTVDAYGYDLAGRLQTVTRNGVLVVTYGYDANGNRNAVTTAGGTTAGTFDAQDRIQTFGTRTYTHTPHGDVAAWTDSATSTATTLTYDVQGNLRQVQQPGTTITYTVDGRNRRIGTAVNGVPVQGFLWQGQLRPVAELDGSGALVSRFVYGTRINVPEYVVKNGTTYRIVTDHLGSVRLVVDTTTNQVVQALAYDPWGVVVQDTNPGFQPFGYAGGLYDWQTGLVRFGVRDYDATIGRWLAKDPIGFSGGDASIYAYALGSPVGNADPSGLDVRVYFQPIVGRGKLVELARAKHSVLRLTTDTFDFAVEIWGPEEGANRGRPRISLFHERGLEGAGSSAVTAPNACYGSPYGFENALLAEFLRYGRMWAKGCEVSRDTVCRDLPVDELYDFL